MPFLWNTCSDTTEPATTSSRDIALRTFWHAALARTAVYWPGIDSQIVDLGHACQARAEHQNKPSKPPVHPWIFPEQPWSRMHLDHAINFLGLNWLLLTDAYSNYPCIHQTRSTSSKAAIDLLEQDLAHFRYPHTLVTDHATSFLSDEFKY